MVKTAAETTIVAEENTTGAENPTVAALYVTYNRITSQFNFSDFKLVANCFNTSFLYTISNNKNL